MSSIKEQAEKLARDYAGYWGRDRADEVLIKLVDQALRDERERAAKIAEKSHQQPCICTTCLIHAEIAAAIRRED